MICIFSANFRQHSQAPACSEPRQQFSLLSWEWQWQGIYLAPILAAWRAASLTAPESWPPQHGVGSRNTLHHSQSIRDKVEVWKVHGAMCGCPYTQDLCQTWKILPEHGCAPTWAPFPLTYSGYSHSMKGKDDWNDRPNRKGAEKTVTHRPRVAMTPASAQHNFLFKNNQQNQHHLSVTLVWNWFPDWPFGSVSILSLGLV